MKILLIGKESLVGSYLFQSLHERDHIVYQTNKKELDIVDRNKVLTYLKHITPDCVCLCSAFTDVNLARKEFDRCVQTNVIGLENVVYAVEQIDSSLLFLSSDYVFDGKSKSAYEPASKRNPINLYGFTKAVGEIIVESRLNKYYIVRTSWVYGKRNNKIDFFTKVVNSAKNNMSIRVVDDLISCPTYAGDLANSLAHLIESSNYGIHHIVNEGACSKYAFAKRIYQLIESDANVVPIKTKDFIEDEIRPKNSVLSTKQTIVTQSSPLPKWEHSLTVALQEFN